MGGASGLPRWRFSIHFVPWALLVADAAWTLYWLGVALYLLLAPALNGLVGTSFRSVHRWQVIHFTTTRNTMYVLDEDGIVWYIPVLYAIIALADFYNVMEVALHINRTSVDGGVAWTLEMVGTSVALFITVVALSWTLVAFASSWRSKNAEGSRLLQRPLLVKSAYQ